MNEIEILLQTLHSSPENVDLRKLVLNKLLELEDWEKAYNVAEPLKSIPDEQAFAYLQQGICYLKRNEFKEAKESFEIALEFVDSVSLLKKQIYPSLIETLLQLKLLDEAENRLNAYLDDFPSAEIESLKILFNKAGLTPKRFQRVLQEGDPFFGLTEFKPILAKDKIRFEDVAGMETLKETVRIKIIAPFQNPELFKKFKKTAGGGLLLYGPPGCGKTYFAKAISGECNASFFNIGIHDILNMYVGNSEKNIHALFETLRAYAPTICFIDEIDALGRRRDLMRGSSVSNTINMFLSEMDGLQSLNENILIIGATNSVWDVDPAFRRPGRFDDVIFVPPPDEFAREGILEQHLKERPVGVIDFKGIAKDTSRFSGADLNALCEKATEDVLQNIMKTGQERLIETKDLKHALKNLKPSTQEWLTIAENYVKYSNQDGLYDDLKTYLDQNPTKRKMGFLS